MSKGACIGVDGAARRVKGLYVGADGKARRVKKAFVGVDGKARLWWSARSRKTRPQGQTVDTVLFYVRNSAGEDVLVSQIPVAEMPGDMEMGLIDPTNYNYSLLDRSMAAVHLEAQGFTIPEFIEYAKDKSSLDSLRNLALDFHGEDRIAFGELEQFGYGAENTFTSAELYGEVRYNFPAIYEFWDGTTQDYCDPSGAMSPDEVIQWLLNIGELQTVRLSVNSFSRRFPDIEGKSEFGDYYVEDFFCFGGWTGEEIMNHERGLRLVKPMTEDELWNKTPTAEDCRYWVAYILLDMEVRPEFESLGTVAPPEAVLAQDADFYYITFHCATPGACILYNHNFITPLFAPTRACAEGETVEIPKKWFPDGVVTMPCRAVKEGCADAGVVVLRLCAETG